MIQWLLAIKRQKARPDPFYLPFIDKGKQDVIIG
jgi:hypothetical protein